MVAYGQARPGRDGDGEGGSLPCEERGEGREGLLGISKRKILLVSSVASPPKAKKLADWVVAIKM